MPACKLHHALASMIGYLNNFWDNEFDNGEPNKNTPNGTRIGIIIASIVG